jgi:hypothetical protein
MTDDQDDSGDWQPLFGRNTPSDEVQALVNVYATQSLKAVRASVAAALGPDRRADVDACVAKAVMTMYVHELFLRVHQTLKAETT